MYKEIFLLLFIGHFLADYYFQSDSLAQSQKAQSIFIHSLIYTATLLAVVLPVFNRSLFVVALLLAFFHWLVDQVKHEYKKRRCLSYEKSVLIYLLDQMAHLLLILIGGSFLVLWRTKLHYLPFLQRIISLLQLNTEVILSWVLILLVIYKPSSITIRIVLDHFEPRHKKEEDTGITNAGALIGIFERLIILLMLSAGQFTAIGFVLTAKSVARYNRISEDPQFAEYYLLGTLLSSLLVIVSYYVIF